MRKQTSIHYKRYVVLCIWQILFFFVTGENLLSVVKHICSNDNLEDAGADKHGIMVFYDVIGLFMIHYPSRIGAIFNSGLVAVVFLTLLLKYKIRVQRIIACKFF